MTAAVQWRPLISEKKKQRPYPDDRQIRVSCVWRARKIGTGKRDRCHGRRARCCVLIHDIQHALWSSQRRDFVPLLIPVPAHVDQFLHRSRDRCLWLLRRRGPRRRSFQLCGVAHDIFARDLGDRSDGRSCRSGPCARRSGLGCERAQAVVAISCGEAKRGEGRPA